MPLRYIALFATCLILMRLSSALLHANARFPALKSPRISQYLQGNVPASHLVKHPLLRHKKHWELAQSPEQQVPDVCIVNKRSKFSLKDAQFAHRILEQAQGDAVCSSGKTVVVTHDDVCYKALAFLRSKDMQIASPKSIEPPAAAPATTPKIARPKVQPSDVRVTREFKLKAPFASSMYQDAAVEKLASGVLQDGRKFQTLMGATGTGKTFMMGKVIESVQRPTLILAPNKLLAAQLYDELKALFPDNAVEYFVSYYDYFLPEAYISSSDTYIDKVVDINHDIDRLRHSATRSLVERSDVIVVASVSCIYGLGLPQDYVNQATRLAVGEQYKLSELVEMLQALAYKPSSSHSSTVVDRGSFKIQPPTTARRGDAAEGSILIGPSAEESHISIKFETKAGEDQGSITIRSISRSATAASGVSANTDAQQDPVPLDNVVLYPATHHVMNEDDKHAVIDGINEELDARFEHLLSQQKYLEAERLRQRTESDLMMLRAVGHCKGIENYSRHLTKRAPGEEPACLLDYLPSEWLLLVDESHISVPQLQGMYAGDRARKLNLVRHGFRLPSALDNRPLTATEFWSKVNQCIFVSATPGSSEALCSSGISPPAAMMTPMQRPTIESDHNNQTSERVLSKFQPTWGSISNSEASAFLRNEASVENRWWDAEVVIRPTGILDPQVEIRPSSDQLSDLMAEIRSRKAKGERVLITTITKAMAEDLAAYISEQSYPAAYLHSSIKPMERLQILRSLREGTVDVIVGVNLLREGLNLPEVSLVVILDADKEGFLRSDTALIQTIGRASRHVEGKVIMYADVVTGSMRRAIAETNRRRSIQVEYNRVHGVIPRTAYISSTANQLLAMMEHSTAKGKASLNMDRVAARLMNEEAYSLSEEEDLMRDFEELRNPKHSLTPDELAHWDRLVDKKLREMVEARKYELAICLIKLRDLCKQQLSALSAAEKMH